MAAWFSHAHPSSCARLVTCFDCLSASRAPLTQRPQYYYYVLAMVRVSDKKRLRSTVYGGRVRLPFDLQRLEMFYPGLLPTNSHLCRRASPWFAKPPLSVDAAEQLPPCSAEECDGWLRPPEQVYISQSPTIVYRDHTYFPGWARRSSHLWTPIQLRWGEKDYYAQLPINVTRSRLQLAANHLFVGMQPRNRHFYADDSWIEVMRVTMGNRSECVPFYGCWFWPLAGSGVWVNVGRSLRIKETWEAKQKYNVSHDLGFANLTRSHGFDSMQLLHGQRNYGGHRARFHW